MNFAHPNALFWATLAVPIVIFYILKIRLRRVPVSTTLFWRQIFEEKQPRSIWQRLRHLLSLLLQLAMLALLVLALAEPFRPGSRREARRVVLIVDNSASMNADDGDPTRLDAAKAEARRLIDGLRFLDEMAILSAGTAPEVRCGLTGHLNTLRDAVDAIEPTDGPTDVDGAVALARRLLADRDERRIVVLSDGGFDGAEALAEAEDVDLVRLGSDDPANLGITRFQVRRSLTDAVGYEILAQVLNASGEAAECRLEVALHGDGGEIPVDVFPISLEPGATWSRVAEKTSAGGGRLVATLTRDGEPIDDALAVDNAAVAILPRREPRPVTLVTGGSLFLEKVFEAIPLVELNVVAEAPGPSAPAPTVTVFHRSVPAAWPPGDVFVIQPDASTDLWELGDVLQSPIVSEQDEGSPWMAHVKLENVFMPQARKVTFADGIEPTVLAGSLGGEPLYAVIDRPEGGRVAVLTVDLDQSDLPLQTAFPIMMTNALNAFAGAEGELREAASAGAVLEVELPGRPAGERVDWVLLDPDGDERPAAVRDGKATVGPLDDCGIWAIARRFPDAEAGADGAPSPPEVVVEIACNLADPRESDLRRPGGVEPERADLGGGLGGRPIWYWMIGLAWALTGAEWLLYQRRWIN